MNKNATMNEWESVLAKVEPDEAGMKIDAMLFSGYQKVFPAVTDFFGNIIGRLNFFR